MIIRYMKPASSNRRYGLGPLGHAPEIRPTLNILLLICAGLLLGLVCLQACASSDKKIDMRYYPKVRSSAFPSPYAARFVTVNGDLLGTDDGGLSWTTVSGKGLGLFDHVAFLDPQQGWADTRDRRVLRTTDGGRSWLEVSSLAGRGSGGLGEIGFVDSSHGWMVVPSAVWLTRDGGVTWRSSPAPLDPSQTMYFCTFKDPEKGWLTGSGGGVYRTTDGGDSWGVQDIGAGKEDLNEISFLNSSTAWTFSVTHPRILWSFDGGVTWQALPGPPKPSEAAGLQSLDFIDPDNGWALTILPGETAQPGRRPPESLVHSVDGGKTWTRVEIGHREPFMNKVRFIDDSHGWLLGVHKIYRTDDGGLTWRAVLNIP